MENSPDYALPDIAERLWILAGDNIPGTSDQKFLAPRQGRWVSSKCGCVPPPLQGGWGSGSGVPGMLSPANFRQPSGLQNSKSPGRAEHVAIFEAESRLVELDSSPPKFGFRLRGSDTNWMALLYT